MKIELNRDWSEFLCALIARRVRFVLVGGHAVAGHGEARMTEDLDVFVDRTLPNARRLREALIDFGFGSAVPEAKELARPDRVIMLGEKPWRIDILTGIDGVSFDQAWATRVEAAFVARPLYVIGRDMLLRNKRAAGRDKDLLDVSMLEAHASPGPPIAAKKKAAKKKAAKKKAAKKKAGQAKPKARC